MSDPVAPAAPQRRPSQQHLLTVVRSTRLSPHLTRVVFSGGPANVYGNLDASDAYLKLIFSTDGSQLTPPVDLVAWREAHGPDRLPVRRTYSVRAYDTATEELSIDFVVHGDEGVAGPWAASAQPGDTLVGSSPGGAYAPAADADFHLLVGDESALPAIAASLERLAPDARGLVFVEVDGAADRIELAAPADVEVRWLHRDGAPAGTAHPLADELATITWPEGDVHVFAHGEREQMKHIRAIVKEHGVERHRLSLSGYWAYGRSEDRFQAEKREPIGVIG